MPNMHCLFNLIVTELGNAVLMDNIQHGELIIISLFWHGNKHAYAYFTAQNMWWKYLLNSKDIKADVEPHHSMNTSPSSLPPLLTVVCSMSVTQAMEWLIEHVDDPSVDTPLPGQESSGATATATAMPGPSLLASASVCGPLPLRSVRQASTEEGSRQDELTEIFKRIRRKREFRPDSRVGDVSPFLALYLCLSLSLICCFSQLL